MDLENDPLSPEAREIIVAAKELETLKTFPGWKRIEMFSEQWIKDALDNLENSVSGDPNVSHRLKLIYAERRSYMRSLHGWMDNIIEGRKQIIRDLAEANQIAEPESLVEMLDRRQ